MNAQRSLGFALVVLQAAALVYCFRTPMFSSAIVAAALFGWLSSFRLASPETARRWAIALAVLYIIQRTVIPAAWYSGVQSFFFSDACLIAEYFLVFQVAQFFVRREGDRLPSYLPILAIVALTFTGDFQASGHTRLVFQAFSLVLIALTAGYFAACRVRGGEQPAKPLVGRRVLLGIVLATSGALAWVAASNLYRYARQIETVLGAVMNPPSRPESVGFSGKGRLGSVARQKANAGSRVALRVYADDSPGYLRGRAFDTYDRAEWRVDGEQTTLTPDTDEDSSPSVLPSQGDVRTFSLIRSETDAWNRQEIWPNRAFQEVVFVPLGLAALQLPVDKLSVNMHGIIETNSLPSGAEYVALTFEETTQLPVLENTRDDSAAAPHGYVQRVPPPDWKLLTSVPDDLDPRIGALAVRVAGRSTTAREKIAAVERHFLDNYQYQFGIDIPEGRDPLTYFLLEKPPAHCEYFASGAAVLLRSVGVPCRYVTGFVVAERNNYGDYWVARNRDAHAWVEAFDPEQGWVVVEATPANGVPQETSASAASQMWDTLRAQWQRLVAAIRKDGMSAVLDVLRRWFVRPWFLVLLLLVTAAIALRWMWRRRGQKPARPRDPCLGQFERLLNAMDRRWQKAGLSRQPHETLHQFAERVTSAASDPAHHQAAEWYRQFAAIRFSGQVDAASVQMLRDAFAATVAVRIAQ
ncbi:MAG: transglutaminase domain-containing protein [Planctomycetes bacterium]|nr:transglutaminase domain-containing protein [Planctomycetota bacterium]MBL7042001.1 transglutaminase domain-containing protein [Pirellulaceae bacterium]